jgi:hypothetical protein
MSLSISEQAPTPDYKCNGEVKPATKEYSRGPELKYLVYQADITLAKACCKTPCFKFGRAAVGKFGAEA